MAQQRNYSTEFKRQVVMEYLAGETLYGLSKRHDVMEIYARSTRNRTSAANRGQRTEVPSEQSDLDPATKTRAMIPFPVPFPIPFNSHAGSAKLALK